MTLAPSRQDRDTPYRADHRRSVERSASRGVEPRTLDSYLAWFASRWNDERPTTMHGAGTWFGRPDPPGKVTVLGYRLRCGITAPAHEHASDCMEPMPTKDLSGGSLLGSPRLNESFRRLLENGPYETEHAEYDGHASTDVHYVRPIHAAIASLGHGHPMTARALSAIAYAGFDWRAVATRLRWDEEMFGLYLEKAMHLLWINYHEAPER